MNLTNLIERVNLTECYLNRYLEILADSGLISKQNFGNNKIFFTLTESGLTILKIYRSSLSEAQDSQRNEFKSITISF